MDRRAEYSQQKQTLQQFRPFLARRYRRMVDSLQPLPVLRYRTLLKFYPLSAEMYRRVPRPSLPPHAQFINSVRPDNIALNISKSDILTIKWAS